MIAGVMEFGSRITRQSVLVAFFRIGSDSKVRPASPKRLAGPVFFLLPAASFRREFYGFILSAQVSFQWAE